MGRLTVQDAQGNWCVNGLAWKSLYVGTPITQEVYELLYGCLCKLKDYEDTGLSPDEVEEMLVRDRVRKELKYCKCGSKPQIIKNSPGNYWARCKCGLRTNVCNSEQHAIFCWNYGFIGV